MFISGKGVVQVNKVLTVAMPTIMYHKWVYNELPLKRNQTALRWFPQKNCFSESSRTLTKVQLLQKVKSMHLSWSNPSTPCLCIFYLTLSWLFSLHIAVLSLFCLVCVVFFLNIYLICCCSFAFYFFPPPLDALQIHVCESAPRGSNSCVCRAIVGVLEPFRKTSVPRACGPTRRWQHCSKAFRNHRCWIL